MTLARLERGHLDLLVGDGCHGPRGVHSEGRGGEPGGVAESGGQHGGRLRVGGGGWLCYGWWGGKSRAMVKV